MHSASATRSHRGTTAGALLLLLMPAIFGMLQRRDLVVKELRDLAPWPYWAATPLSAWPAAFDQWLNDHYPMRGYMIRGAAIVQHRWLKQPSNSVVVGRNDWLYYAGEKTVEDFSGDDPLTPLELETWREALDRRNAWWRDRGTTYLFVIVPNKSTIYPENLPVAYRRGHRSGKLDQLLDYLRSQHSTVPILDLRGALFAAKARGEVYWENDSHWNGRGLLAACIAIAAERGKSAQRFEKFDLSSETIVGDSIREGDCVRLLRLSGAWPLKPEPQVRLSPAARVRSSTTALQGVGSPVVFEHDSATGTAVLLCDSFFRLGGLPADAPAQVPLILSFHRFVSVWNWSGTTNLATGAMLEEIADKEHPAVVIEQYTERFLHTMPPIPNTPGNRL